MRTEKLSTFLKLMELLMTELTAAVDALKAEVSILEAWSRDQIAALRQANDAIATKNIELEGAAAELKLSQAVIDELTGKLAAAQPGTEETAAIVSDLKEVVARLDAITPAPADLVPIPEKPTEAVVEVTPAPEPVVDAAPAPEPVVLDEPVPVVDEAPAVVDPEPGVPIDAPIDAGHNGES